MATATGSWGTKQGYNNGWSSYSSIYNFSYVSASQHATVMAFTTPSFAGTGSSLSFSLGYGRGSSINNTSGTFYVSLCSSFPSFSGSYYPSSRLGSVTIDWTAPNRYDYDTGVYTISGLSLQGNTTYYLYITSSKLMQIGGKSSNDIFAGPTVTYTLPTYEVKFDPNGGTGGPGTLIKTYGTNLTVPTNQIPTRTGYNFVEWNTKADGSGYSVQPGGSIVENVSKTMYAIWKIAASVVTLYLPNESGIVEKKRGMVHMYNSDGNLCYAIITIYDETGKRYLAN